MIRYLFQCVKFNRRLAYLPGLEPGTYRLTAGSSTIELEIQVNKSSVIGELQYMKNTLVGVVGIEPIERSMSSWPL